MLCHGGFTLRSVFVDSSLDRVEVPTGDEVMRSAPELDLGWMLGEFTEFEYQAGLRGVDGAFYTSAAGSLLGGWSSATGAEPDRTLLDRVIALRFCLHLCDFAETTRSGEAGAQSAPFLRWLVDRVDTAESRGASGSTECNGTE